MTTPQQLSTPPASQWEVQVNENMTALGQAFVWSHDVTADTGLTVGLAGGTFDETTVAAATLACTNNATNYIVVHRATLVASVAVATTDPDNWEDTATYGRVARVDFASGVLTAWHDERLSPGGIFDQSSTVGVTDGDKGDITVSGSGATWTIDAGAVTYAKMQDVSATSRALGRKTAGSGDVEEVTLSELLDFIGSAAQGDLLYRGAATWARLAAGTAGYLLQTGGAGANPSWTNASVGGGGPSSADVQTFTASGTWTKPTNAKVVRVVCYGGGGGGGGGDGTGSTVRSGAGGGGAARTEMIFAAADLASTVAVTIGAGGAGGTGHATDPTAGAAGGTTTFGSHLSAFGGGGGSLGDGLSRGGGTGGGSAGVGQAGGTGSVLGGLPAVTANVAGYGGGGGGSGTTSASPAEHGGGAGGANASGTGGTAGGTSIFGSGGGGGGGGATSGTPIAGFAGGGIRTYVNAGGGGGTAGTVGGGAGGAGSAATLGQGATGGGGGGGHGSGTGGVGGVGGAGGGGGGGGGGGASGTGGSGGNGGDGMVFVVSW